MIPYFYHGFCCSSARLSHTFLDLTFAKCIWIPVMHPRLPQKIKSNSLLCTTNLSGKKNDNKLQFFTYTPGIQTISSEASDIHLNLRLLKHGDSFIFWPLHPQDTSAASSSSVKCLLPNDNFRVWVPVFFCRSGNWAEVEEELGVTEEERERRKEDGVKGEERRGVVGGKRRRERRVE